MTRVLLICRRIGILMVASLSVMAAVALQFAERTPIDVRFASMEELLVLVGLLFLPVATGTCMALDRTRG